MLKHAWVICRLSRKSWQDQARMCAEFQLVEENEESWEHKEQGNSWGLGSRPAGQLHVPLLNYSFDKCVPVCCHFSHQSFCGESVSALGCSALPQSFCPDSYFTIFTILFLCCHFVHQQWLIADILQGDLSAPPGQVGPWLPVGYSAATAVVGYGCCCPHRFWVEKPLD